MDTTVGKLKIGTPLILGRYGVLNDFPCDIVWLKASPNNDFITRDALDYLVFDASEMCPEGRRPNGDYQLSNLRSFLNSMQSVWFYPTHEFDSVPAGNRVANAYADHYGFLYHFEDYELGCINAVTDVIGEQRVLSRVRLPSIDDIGGDRAFPLFKRKGIRPHPAEDLLEHRRDFYAANPMSYVPFYLSDPVSERSGYVYYYDRDCSIRTQSADYQCGVRPVCTLTPDTPVSQDEDGVYRVVPRACERNVFTDEELFNFLGVAPI